MADPRPNTPRRDNDQGLNPDPITGEPGSHPVGTGIGAAAAGLAGGIIGSVAGPVGTVAGAAIGAAAGGYAGHATAEAIDPTDEDNYWKENYSARPYAQASDPYDSYRPAYRLGWEGYESYGRSGKSFDDVQDQLHRQWDSSRGESGQTWDRAKLAVKDAWERIAGRSTGGSSRHGR